MSPGLKQRGSPGNDMKKKEQIMGQTEFLTVPNRPAPRLNYSWVYFSLCLLDTDFVIEEKDIVKSGF